MEMENELLEVASEPVCGTSIQRTLKLLMPAKPRACTGNVFEKPPRLAVFRSPQAPAIRPTPVRKPAASTTAVASPAPNETLPLELRKKLFCGLVHVGPAVMAPCRNS